MPQGRTPKPAHLRQNRTRKAGATTLDDAPRRRMPSLPEIGRGWHELTLRWWRNVWHSPMAPQYLDTDVDALVRLAIVVNQFYEYQDPKVLAEIRLQEARFGLSPVDRSRLQWEVAKGQEAERRHQAPEPQRVDSNADPRAVLRAVS